MTNERKRAQDNDASFENLTCAEMIKMMDHKAKGCDCAQMMYKMSNMNDEDDSGWSEIMHRMMGMCCPMQDQKE